MVPHSLHCALPGLITTQLCCLISTFTPCYFLSLCLSPRPSTGHLHTLSSLLICCPIVHSLIPLALQLSIIMFLGQLCLSFLNTSTLITASLCTINLPSQHLLECELLHKMLYVGGMIIWLRPISQSLGLFAILLSGLLTTLFPVVTTVSDTLFGLKNICEKMKRRKLE